MYLCIYYMYVLYRYCTVHRVKDSILGTNSYLVVCAVCSSFSTTTHPLPSFPLFKVIFLRWTFSWMFGACDQIMYVLEE